MAGSIYAWSTTAASNASSDGDINWNEGQAPSTVNNSARQVMGRVAEWVKDQGALTAGGTANAITVTANSAFTSYATGQVLAFKAATDNNGATTLSVNAIGAKSIRKFTPAGEVALAAGDLKGGGIFVVRYDAAANSAVGGWVLSNPVVSRKPAFRVHRNGVLQGTIPSGTYTKFMPTTEAFDICDCFDLANGRWTPLSGSVHLVGVIRTMTLGIVVDEEINAAIYKNGSIIAESLTRASTNSLATGFSISVTDQANNTDYYELFVRSTGGSWRIDGTASNSYFCGYTM